MSRTRRSSGATWLRPFEDLTGTGELPRLLALMTLFFLVVCAVGILRPIKNSLALDGLGSTDFYRVYLVSAAVVLFVPAFNRLADRVPWRALFASVALFFALNLVVFRLVYVEGSAAFGLIFYGWYDLFAAALVTQFFMATQFYFDARSAKRAYPLVIAGGSIGATLGGAITGFFAESVGTPNLLLVAAALIAAFACAIPWVLHGAHGDDRPRQKGGLHGQGKFRELLAHRQVRLIAATVLLTIIVKQLVDYQFNAITKDVFDTRDAVSAFQGKFNAATQWLPLIVLAALRPALRRWGMGVAVLLLPVLMFAGTIALALTFGLVAAAAAKGAETSLRYSAERAGREILYVPVPDAVKLKAKAYIDVAIEKGIGKVASALLIMLLLQFMTYRQIAWVSAGLAGAWVIAAVAVRREYVHTLARSIEGRFASLRGVFASLLDASSLPLVRRALEHPAPLRVAFGLELIAQLPDDDIPTLAPELRRLTEHPREQIRAGALTQLARCPDEVDGDRARALLLDADPAVRAAAVHALLAASGENASGVLHELLHHDSAAVRTAALQQVLGNGSRAALRDAGRAFVQARTAEGTPADPDARVELALAAGSMHGDAAAERLLAPFLDDEDPRVRSTALRSAALLGRTDCCERMIVALADPATREAAADALALMGTDAVPPLEQALMSHATIARARRVIPSVLARIPTQATVDAMLRLVLAPETDQVLDQRTIRALGKLRAKHPELAFPEDLVHQVAERESDAAALYASVRAGLTEPPNGRTVEALLRAALHEAWQERRENVFRCLGLVHPPQEVRRAHAAVTRGSGAQRANALEWLEEHIGATQFRRFSAVLEPGTSARQHAPVSALLGDGDAWIATLAELLLHGPGPHMELIEKVFLLQQVDLLQGTRGAHVALLAAIAEEVEVPAGTLLLTAGDVPDSMYVVTRGSVELTGVGGRMVVNAEQAFGTWALIDDQPSPVDARATEATSLLRVTRTDFQDLLADHPEIGLGMLRGLAHRVRSLVA